MRQNENTVLIGKRATLVPYKKEHVLRYHEWMKSEELQQLTASEPLSLEQEYEMQASWHLDDDKCTFIVLDSELYQSSGSQVESMAGDVNLFFNEHEDRTAAELEIMIAEPTLRGKGLGKEAALMMMRYGIDSLGVKRYTAKIGCSNQTSLSMFHKLGFTQISISEVFQEVTLQLNLDPEMVQRIQELTCGMKISTLER